MTLGVQEMSRVGRTNHQILLSHFVEHSYTDRIPAVTLYLHQHASHEMKTVVEIGHQCTSVCRLSPVRVSVNWCIGIT